MSTLRVLMYWCNALKTDNIYFSWQNSHWSLELQCQQNHRKNHGVKASEKIQNLFFNMASPKHSF